MLLQFSGAFTEGTSNGKTGLAQGFNFSGGKEIPHSPIYYDTTIVVKADGSMSLIPTDTLPGGGTREQKLKRYATNNPMVTMTQLPSVISENVVDQGFLNRQGPKPDNYHLFVRFNSGEYGFVNVEKNTQFVDIIKNLKSQCDYVFYCDIGPSDYGTYSENGAVKKLSSDGHPQSDSPGTYWVIKK